MREKLEEFIQVVKTENYEGKRKEQYLRLLTAAAAAFMMVSIVMSIMNLVKQYYFMAATTIVFAIGFAVCIVLSKKYKKWEPAVIVAGILLAIILTTYLVTGGNEGFAALWILVLPPLALYLMGIRWGLILTTYFLVLLIALFYTPLRFIIEDYYTVTFLNRFPILYICSMVVSLLLILQNHIILIKQNNYEQELETAVLNEREKVMTISMQTILSISNMVDAKDKYTQEHSKRVATYSCLLAEKLGWTPEQIDELRSMALLHDIGKVGVKDVILNKPGGLTDEEYTTMKDHPIIGGNILKELSLMPNVSIGAKYHHERYDGKGYPYGLAGEAIPVEARIIGIVDAFDAMNSRRVYSERSEWDYIIRELKNGRGTQFDPELLDVFLEVLEENEF